MVAEREGVHLEELASWRQLAYRLFSSVFLYPDKRRLETIAATAAGLSKEREAMAKFTFFPQWRRLLTSLVALPAHHALEEEYVRVFMHSPERTPCLPYESAYLDPGGQATGWVAALLEQEYATAGLALSSSLGDQPDHISVELEFMAFLCGQESDAWHREVVKDGVQTLERQASFLDRHLIRWFPEWTQQVASATSQGIYFVATETAQSFISHDQDLISLLLDKFRRMPPAAQAGGRQGALKKPPQ